MELICHYGRVYGSQYDYVIHAALIATLPRVTNYQPPLGPAGYWTDAPQMQLWQSYYMKQVVAMYTLKDLGMQ